MHIDEPEFFFNLTRVAHQKFWVSPPPPGSQERSSRGAAKSLNTGLAINI